jgi:hypothetical protein
MGHHSHAADEVLRSRLETTAGLLAGAALLLLPLMALSVLDIAQGDENLSLEWSLVLVGLVVACAAQVATLALLGQRRSRGRV